MSGRFTDERNALMLMSLMKAHGVRKVIASPGTTNVSLVASMQRDPYFELYSAVDERSAGYMACGLAEESGEAVALSCTQATASRNYLPALTEAYYRKLPVLAITSTQHLVRVGQNIQQAIDRSEHPVDTLRKSVHIPIIHDDDDALYANIKMNDALLELKRDGGGPVHINLTTTYGRVFDVDELPEARAINRICPGEPLPQIPSGARVAVFVGAHSRWDEPLTRAVDDFCGAYGAVALCDATSNYFGRARVNHGLLFSQGEYSSPAMSIDVLIHIGNTSGSNAGSRVGQVWRVCPDGEIRDTFGKLRYVFEMGEREFFSAYADRAGERKGGIDLPGLFAEECGRMLSKVPDIPLSNAWLAQATLPRLPEGCVLHLGIYNSLRTWSLFEPAHPIPGYCNTGGFGIDGGISTMIGGALGSTAIHFGVFGDLAFFYDMNSLGNRHLPPNIRLIVVNNGCGVEFKEHINRAYPLGEEADPFIAARGHYGSQSRELVKHYAEDLGFIYHAVETKEEYLALLDEFVSPDPLKAPMLVEVFTEAADETESLKRLYGIESSASGAAKRAVKKLVGEKGTAFLRQVLK